MPWVQIVMSMPAVRTQMALTSVLVSTLTLEMERAAQVKQLEGLNRNNNCNLTDTIQYVHRAHCC